jgi:DNA-binding CsgD family transcriptional regulator
MTLVFNEPREGPATHALIVGVEHPSPIETGAISASLSARAIAVKLLGLDFDKAPLGSVELIASYSPHAREFVSPRDGVSYTPEPPLMDGFRRALTEWLDRAARDPGSLAFFYYAGPIIELDSTIIMAIPAPGPTRASGADFANLWTATRALPVANQLFFIDACPTEQRAGRVIAPPLELLAQPETEPRKRSWRRGDPPVPKEGRGRFHARMSPQAAQSSGKQVSFMTAALRSALTTMNRVHLGELGRLLQLDVRNRIVTAGLEPLPLEYEVEGDVRLSWREREGSPSPDAAAAAAVPAGPKASPPAPTSAWPPPADRGSDYLPDRAPPASGQRVFGQEAFGQAAFGQSASPEHGEESGARRADGGHGAAAGLPGKGSVKERIASLSPRHRRLLRLVQQGRSTGQMATELHLSTNTVSHYLSEAIRRLGVNGRHEAAQLLAEHEDEAETGAPDEGITASPGGPEAAIFGQTWQPAPEPNTHFVSDDPEVERDELNRGPLAIALGRRLHRIWCRSNGIKVPGDDLVEAGGDERAAFVLHLDAPWGGGKTSFANFLSRVLNPFPRGAAEAAKFLAERAGEAVGTIFIDDPPADGKEGGTAAQWPDDARRPWIVVQFNAWQAEHCTPPWWTFYQAIRKGCFAAVWAEGRSAARPAQASAPPRPFIEERIWSWAALWRRELMWRLRTPKVVARFATFAVAALALLILWRSNIVFRGDEGPDFNAGNALGFVLAGIGGISGLWGLGALLTESVAPGTDDVAERRSLGGGDPFERFRRHFGRTMAAVRRPVMVIVDDLDRCRPDFVVDLVRGIQTLLRSPRVVFVILGDRDWIERAFEAHHAAMSKVNVGPEQDFGARFVEKAIQMSFILPEMPQPSQESYVRRVLIGPGASAAAADPPPPPEIAQQLRAEYRETVAAAESVEERQLAEQALRHKYESTIHAIGRRLEQVSNQLFDYKESDYRMAPDAEAAGAQADKLLSEERALLAAVDERMGQALLHRLEPLARFFPPNPRQIKRIVNAITMYTAVAYLQMDMDESDPRGIELAIWVIVMTEWPKTWRVLASCPKLADVLAADDPEAALDAIDEGTLPGSRASTLQEIKRVRCERELFALLTEESEDRPRLHTASVDMFVRLTPLYSRKRLLAEEVK